MLAEKELARKEALQWVSGLFEDHFIILDTETSNWPEKGGEVIQFGIIDSRGNVLLNTLLKPQQPISPEASKVHHITNQDVAHSPTFPVLYPFLKVLLEGHNTIAYNVAFDSKALDLTCDKYKLPRIKTTWHCAMLQYAQFKGDWNDFRGNYKWHKLGEACKQNGIPVIDAHDATADVTMTLKLMEKMHDAVLETTI